MVNISHSSSTSRNDQEVSDLTLLGSQNNSYRDDYAPEVLETFVNKHQENEYFVKFNCLSLQVFVLLRVSQILPRSTFRMSLMYVWWNRRA